MSEKADKTITVRIDVAHRHRRYAKVVRTSSTLHAHDEANDAHTATVRCEPPVCCAGDEVVQRANNGDPLRF